MRPNQLTHRRPGAVAIFFAAAFALHNGAAAAQERVALKSGESIDLGPVYWVANCRSIMLGLPEVEILEGPAELTLSIRKGMVIPRRQNCPNKVDGGTLVLTVKEVGEAADVKLAYRLKYKPRTAIGSAATCTRFRSILEPPGG